VALAPLNGSHGPPWHQALGASIDLIL